MMIETKPREIVRFVVVGVPVEVTNLPFLHSIIAMQTEAYAAPTAALHQHLALSGVRDFLF